MKILRSGHCWRCGRFTLGKEGRQRHTCGVCRAYLTRPGAITLAEAQGFCERIARLYHVPCRVKVLRRSGFFYGRNPRVHVIAIHRIVPGSRPRRCFILLHFRRFRYCRAVAFWKLLQTMIHEISHHFEKSEGGRGHGNRWRSQCSSFAREWGLSLKHCW